MPPIAEKGGGGWACGRHHHRERLRNHRVLRARQDDHVRRGVHFHQLPCVRRRQRQQLAPRASRWRCGGAKQTALAPREGQALEERSSSSRSASRPRTRGRQLPCVRRRQRQQLAPRASRWRRGGAKQKPSHLAKGKRLRNGRVPRAQQDGHVRVDHSCRAYDDDNGSSSRRARADGAAEAPMPSHLAKGRRKGGPGRLVGTSRIGTASVARGVQQPCVTTTTAAARARQARRANGHAGHVLASVRGSVPAAQGPRAVAQPTCAAQERTPCVTTTTAAYVDVTRRRRQLALEERGGARARGARRFLTENKELRRQLERAAAYRGGQRARRASQ